LRAAYAVAAIREPTKIRPIGAESPVFGPLLPLFATVFCVLLLLFDPELPELPLFGEVVVVTSVVSAEVSVVTSVVSTVVVVVRVR